LSENYLNLIIHINGTTCHHFITQMFTPQTRNSDSYRTAQLIQPNFHVVFSLTNFSYPKRFVRQALFIRSTINSQSMLPSTRISASTRRLITLGISLLIGLNPGSAQTIGNNLSLPNVAQPAPQSASLGRYGEIPVSVHTGVPDISVPLCAVSSGKLSLPISISYHGSGVKVMDMASPTGMCWTLNAGPDISRVVQGQPDESTYGFPTLRLPDPKDPSLAAKEKCLSNNICNTANGIDTWDAQPDLFYYSLIGKSGQFMIKNSISNAQSLSFMTIPYAPVQINSPTGLATFEITDDDGTQYFFARYDWSITSANTMAHPQTTTTAWHVVKIRSANNADSITFKYNTVSHINYSTSVSRTLRLLYDGWGNPNNFAWGIPSITNIATTAYLLSEIDFNNGKLTLDYSNALATDQSIVLNAIHLFNLAGGGYNELKRFTFYHSAFINNGTSTNVSRLDSLQVSGYYNTATPVKQPVYAFNYYGDSYWQIPPFNSYGQDFWGYFNGRTGNSDMVFVGQSQDYAGKPIIVSNAYKRVPDSSYLKIGTLKSIKYPTGGTSTFDFEPNQIIQPISKMDTTHFYAGLNAYISTFGILPNDASSFSYTFKDTTNFLANYHAGLSGPYYNAQLILNTSPYCTSGSANCISNLATVQVNDITSGSQGPVVAQINNNNPSTTTSTTQTALFNIVKGHTYKVSFPYQSVLPNSSSNFQFRLDANVQAHTTDSVSITAEPPVNQVVLTGGLRIRKITSSDQNGNTLIKQYKYTGTYYNSSLFHGDFDVLAKYSYAFDGWGVLGFLAGTYATPTNPTGKWGRVMTSYTANLPLPLGGESNNAVSYNEVEEYESDGNGNNNGKTVYDYGNKVQDIVTMNMPFFKVSKQEQRSQLTEKRTYISQNGGYTLLKDELTNYTDLNAGMTNADTVVFYTVHGLLDQGSIPNESVGILNGGAAAGALGCAIFDEMTQFLTNRYYYTSSRFVPQSNTVTTYDNSGNALASTVSYSYQNPAHCFPTHTHIVNSAGKQIDTYTRYVPDQTFPSSCSNSCVNNLQQQLAVLKQRYFPIFLTEDMNYGHDWFQQVFYSSNMGTNPSYVPLFQQSANATIADENVYQQTMNNYQNSIDSLVNIYNTCNSNYNNCIAAYYATAPLNQKAIIDMQAQNNITPHLEDSTYTNNVLISRLQNNYLTFSPNVTLPSKVQFAALNNPLEDRLQFNNYDGHGNILRQQKANGPYQSYQWGYNGEYPVARAVNAGNNDIFYESFEEGNGNSTSNDAKTGHYSHTGAYTKALSGLDPGSYTLTYWQKSGSAWSLVSTPVTVAGSTYTIGASPVINGQIDDVRFYPATAQMSTYTVDPLVGMTSSTDAKGETTYYEYDSFQRLKNIKDKDGNIIKHTDYHYQGN